MVNTQYNEGTDAVLQNCTPETYLILLTNVTPINSIQKNDTSTFRTRKHVFVINLSKKTEVEQFGGKSGVQS